MKIPASIARSVLAALTLTMMVLVLPDAARAGQGHGNGNGQHDSHGDGPGHGGPKACSAIARLAKSACQFAAADDFLIATANCTNIADRTERADCDAEARAGRKDALDACGEQLAARNDVCDAIGDGPYEVDLDPANFMTKQQVVASPNPLFPLVPGRTYHYRNGDEDVRTTITDQTKQIEGITVIVVSDVSRVNGQLTESTENWFAEDLQGNVWYFGEIAQQYENGELVSIDGSWKTGVDGALPGIAMEALPQVGDVYRQEYALGEAEDMGEVLNVNGSATVPARTCTSTCLVTHDFSALEPDANEQKFYAPGTGLILTIDQTTGAREELIEILNTP